MSSSWSRATCSHQNGYISVTLTKHFKVFQKLDYTTCSFSNLNLFNFQWLCAHWSLSVVLVLGKSRTWCDLLPLQLTYLKIQCVVYSEMLFCSPRLQRVVFGVTSYLTKYILMLTGCYLFFTPACVNTRYWNYSNWSSWPVSVWFFFFFALSCCHMNECTSKEYRSLLKWP